MRLHKLVTILITAAMMLTLVACSKKNDNREIRYFTQEEVVEILTDKLGVDERYIGSTYHSDAVNMDARASDFMLCESADVNVRYYADADEAYAVFVLLGAYDPVKKSGDNYRYINGYIGSGSHRNYMYGFYYLNDNMIIKIITNEDTSSARKAVKDVLDAFALPDKS